MIRISGEANYKNFKFELFNKTDNSIKIIWDGVNHIDENDNSHRIIHSGIRCIDKNEPQPVSVITRNASLKDITPIR